jgi:hypothetical protein
VWRTIQSAYAKAPFFEFYADHFYRVLQQPYERLFDLNYDLLSTCLKILGCTPRLCHTDTYQHHYPDDVTDFRGRITPGQPDGIIHARKYIQLFSDRFVENLSMLDAIFCIGPETTLLLQEATLTIGQVNED